MRRSHIRCFWSSPIHYWGTWASGTMVAMTTTTVATPALPHSGQSAPTRKYATGAERRKKLEAELEELFYKSVRGLLRGQLLKLAPLRKGTPDRLVLLPGGRMELVELKAEDGRLSPAQRLVHAQFAQVGILVTVLYGEAELLDWVAKRQAQRSTRN